MRLRHWVVVITAGWLTSGIATALGDDASAVKEPLDQFNKVVAPALAAKCVACHRPDNLKGGLDLSTREGMIKGGDGGSAMEPRSAENSPIYTRSISHEGRPPEMPAKGEPLTTPQADVLRDWINSGSAWPENFVLREKARADASFWSFQPIAKVEPPTISDGPDEWRRHPIDRFVLASLRKQGLRPNPPASPHAFIRRATYDLTGLPPTPEEVEAFTRAIASLGENAAVEQLIDRLLDSPHYGEAWGRHWLDVIRFGESRGYERNEIITNLWPFRDYVINSINADKPFDELIREHLAGDLIGKDQPEIEVGSAFLVAGPYDDVGNQDAVAAAQIRADQIDEMIRATSEAFLGLTLGCCRCHDHKFDPLPTRDYYSLYATFSGTVHGARDVATAAAREERTARLKPLQEEREQIIKQRDELGQAIVKRMSAREDEAAKGWVRPRQQRYLTEERFAPTDAAFVRLVVDGTDSSDPKTGRFKLDEFEIWTDEENSRNVALAMLGAKAVGAARDAKDFAGAYSAELVIDGKFGERWQPDSNQLVIQLAKPERISRVTFSSDRTKNLSEDNSLTTFVGDYQIEVSMDGKEWKQVANSFDRMPASEIRRQARLRKLVTTDDDVVRLGELQRSLAAVDQKIAQVPALSVWWVGTHRPAAGPFKVFVGGSPQRPGDEVVPASLSVFEPIPSRYRLEPAQDEGVRRLALAKWLTSPDHPLVPRVLANRIWHYHFGAGIVNTPSDFGYMGGRPSHPELLDWLSRELLSHGWKLKPLHRLIMTSQTYRQSAAWREDSARVDADSRLLWRFPPRRLSAEEVRDTLLSVAGKLDFKMGGPGFRLYEYLQDNVATYVPLDEHGPETYRRAVYHHNARASRVDVLTDFDCPDPAFAEPRRASTTTPLQALTLMNHRFSLTMANSLAERLEREATTADGQLRRAFALTYSREPTDREVKAGVEVIARHGLRSFCRAILNSNELIQVD